MKREWRGERKRKLNDERRGRKKMKREQGGVREKRQRRKR